jgi:hypothetical protein
MSARAVKHFLTIQHGCENLRKLGEPVLWKGAQEIVFQAG